jgi:carbonic anhydrase
MNTLDNIPDGTTVIVDASRTNYIHPDVEEIIEDFKTHASFSNITLEVIK